MDRNSGRRDISSETSLNYKEILERINRVQKHFMELSKAFTQYNEKTAQARDKSDEIAKCLMKYKQVEPFETTSQYAVQLAADIIGKVGNHQTAAILRVQKKVLPNLSTYQSICKCLKGEVTSAMDAQSRALAKKKVVKAFDQKGLSDPRYRNATPDAEREFENALAEFSRLTTFSQEQVVKFEHKRLVDLKQSLETFFKIQIANHAKSLELLTDGYRFIHSIDEDSDLKVLKRRLNLQTALSMAENFRLGPTAENYSSRKQKRAARNSEGFM